ncbi:MAG: c-type cytochrome [Acidimicrobiia bacterium]
MIGLIGRGVVVALLAVGLVGAVPTEGAAQWYELSVPERPALDDTDVEAGREVYEDRCWFCHGEEGDGEGPVAPYLFPRPRDFTVGSYKLRTTQSGELPLDEDLFRTITLGIPGTAMPGWESHLTDEERWQVVEYIKSFAADLFEDEFFDPYQTIVEIGDPPSGAEEDLIAAGQTVYDENKCWECHGALGRGDGEKAPELRDDWDFPIVPANLHVGWKIKGGRSVSELYLRFSTGLDGTPMPSYEATVSEEQRWQLAYYMASLTGDVEDDRSGGGVIISARRIDGPLPAEPTDPEWEGATEVSVPLTGQATFAPRWEIPAVTDLAIRVLFNEDQIALRLAWDDRFADTIAVDSVLALAEGWSADDTYPVLFPDGQRVRGYFSDAAEVMIPVRYEESPILPHLVYGNAGKPVDLWRWQADRQYAQGNTPAVVELRADGAARPPEPHEIESQNTTGGGVWADGRWTVVIRRSLQTEAGTAEVQLRPGDLIPLAFHVWEGNNGETGLRMGLSSWAFLDLHEPEPVTSYLAVLLFVLVTALLEWGIVRWVQHGAALGRLARFDLPGLATGREQP